jgi:uncharacterized protein DUF5348
MATLSLEKDASGWRHYIGDRPVYCGSTIEVRIFGEWVSGRYEMDYSPHVAPRPLAMLYVDRDDAPIRVEEFTEARFPAKYGD